ncbi:hypothetical protein ACFVH0_12755 [Streptomyces sp. NPDC127117]|uniref:hypothetical protein n=1 Tax=Streptomyces sp. NPDC127117 TaxID=3345368 RepID=UPI0036367EA9
MSAALEVPADLTGAMEEPEVRALLADLDGKIISMVLRRVELARYDQSLRRLSGMPVSELAWENEVLERYGDELGRKGVDIGRAVLALSRLRTEHRPARQGPPEPE